MNAVQFAQFVGKERCKELFDRAIQELILSFCNSGSVVGPEEAELFEMLYYFRDNC